MLDEEGGTRRKDGRGGRSVVEERAMRRVKKSKSSKENENRKWHEDASLTPAVLFSQSLISEDHSP